MAAYQIPQFLDSGDKILGPLNFRQFGYALGGFFICIIIFTIVNSIVPGLGIYAIIPAVPVAILAAYLALGKYNGRDSEVYILKMIVFMTKPRLMVYDREPYLDDLNQKLNEWTIDKVSQRWNQSVSTMKEDDKDDFAYFRDEETKRKAQKIRNLGKNLDTNLYNTLETVQRKNLVLEKNQQILQSFAKTKNKTDPNLPAPEPYPNQQIEKPKAENFFNYQKPDLPN